MESAIFISDSTAGITNAITDPTQLVCHQLTIMSGNCIRDMADTGMAISGRTGYPYFTMAVDLNDIRNVIRRDLSAYVFVMMGVNDYDLGHSDDAVITQLVSFIQFCQNLGKSVVIITPLSTANEGIDRPNLHFLRGKMAIAATENGCILLEGPSMLNIAIPAYWADGVHPSQLGHPVIAANINSTMAALDPTWQS